MTEPIAEQSVKYVRRQNTEDIYLIAQKRPVRYVFLDGSNTYRMVLPFLEKEYTVSFVQSYSHAYEMLINNEADTFVYEAPLEYGFDILDGLIASNYEPVILVSYALSTKKPELAPIINILQKSIDAGAGKYYKQLYNKGVSNYLHNKLFSVLAEEEVEYLREHADSVIPICVEYANYPLAFYNSKEKAWQGLAIDILEKVSNITGLNFERVNDTRISMTEMMKMLATGEIALITELGYSPERSGYFLWSDAYYSLDYPALLSRSTMEDINVIAVEKYRVGIIQDTYTAQLFKLLFPNNSDIVDLQSEINSF
jgi:ABC-type amino acid transport substrate-binding protein